MDRDHPGLVHWHRRQRIIQYAALLVSIIVSTTANILQSLYVREPYHTSALSGEAWVLELLCGHPNRICTELGVSLEVFSNLVQELRDIGHHVMVCAWSHSFRRTIKGRLRRSLR